MTNGRSPGLFAVLAVAGATTAHALTYVAVHAVRHGGEVVTVHGYRPGLAAVLLAATVVGLLHRVSRPRPGSAALPTGPLLRSQLLVYGLLLVGEWTAASVPIEAVLHDPWVWAGIATNVVVAVVLNGLGRLLDGAAAWLVRLGPVVGARPVRRWSWRDTWSAAVAGGVGQGGPRAPPVR